MTHARRPLPTETVAGLIPPHRDFPYFEHAASLPFQPAAREYSPINPWWLADASLLAYASAGDAEAAFAGSPLGGLGFRLEWLGTAEENRGLVLRGEEVILIVFRGTRIEFHPITGAAEIAMLHQDDLWLDSQFLLTEHPAGGRVHHGFLAGFTSVAPQLEDIVGGRTPRQAIWLTGHSLGGALATLAAAHLGADVVQGLYTLGAPRVGDQSFTAALPGPSHFRLVHRDDWVPGIPPEFLGYLHAGTPVAVTGSTPRDMWQDLQGSVSEISAAFSSMAREGKLPSRELPLKVPGIADHMPIYYATLLWNAVADGA